MKDKTYQAIVDALDLLASGRAAKTNGKVTAVNVAKEAGVGKATLYRNFDEHSDLRDAFDAMRKNGIRVADEVPESIQQAYRLLKDEVKRLRSELAETKRNADHANKLKAHQILLLWRENERLQSEVRRFGERGRAESNVLSLYDAANQERAADD